MQIYKKEIGDIIPNLTINGDDAPYPVLNERSIRAAAGIMFFVGITTVLFTYFTKDFFVVSIVLPLFLLNFIVLAFW